MSAITVVAARWWRGSKLMSIRYAWFNIALGIVCLVLALLGIDLGLGETYGLWMLGLVFGVVPLAWGALALPYGRRMTIARPLRLVGDILLWSGMVVFAVLGLVAADPAETGPLVTLVGFILVTTIGAIINHRQLADSNDSGATSI